MSPSLCCLRAGGLPTATLYTNQIKHTNDSADTDIFTLMSVAEYVLIFMAHLFLPFLRGLMFHLLTHIRLQMGRGNKRNKGKKVVEMGRSIKTALSSILCLLYIRWKIGWLFASDSLSHFNIWSSSDRTSIEAKWSFLLVPFEMRDEVLSKGFWKDSKSAGISPREMDYGKEIGETLKGWINESFCTTCDGPPFPHHDCWQWCRSLGLIPCFGSLLHLYIVHLFNLKKVQSIKSDPFIFLINLFLMNMQFFFLLRSLVTMLLISQCMVEKGVQSNTMEQLVLHVAGCFLLKNEHVLKGKQWSGGGGADHLSCIDVWSSEYSFLRCHPGEPWIITCEEIF